MATLDLPVPPLGVAKWQVRVELEDTFYRILYKWNARDLSWYMDWADDTGTALLRSRRVVLGTDIFRAFKAKPIPQGVLSIVDTTGEHQEPTRDDLGDRVRIQYTEVEDGT